MLHHIASAVAKAIESLPDMPLNAVQCRMLHEWDGPMLTPRVAVTPRGLDAQNASRSAMVCDYRVGIYVAKRALSESDAAEVFRIAEIVLDRLRVSPVLDLPNTAGRVVFLSATMDLSAEETLNEQNVYRALIEATYKLLKV